MLSIIVSSKDKRQFDCLKKNIDSTVGCKYELIQIENQNKFGICEAYNRGFEISKFENICFIHEDICFHTKNWGQNIIRILQNKSIGLTGVAGSRYRSSIPSMWSLWYYPEKSLSLNIWQHIDKKVIHQKENWSGDNLEDVVVCDGVFLCTRKDVVTACLFDSKLFTGFHFYDLDFSLSIFQNYRVCVTQEVLIEHYSNGHLSDNWAHEALIFRKKWGKKLPLSLNDLTEIEKKRIEEKNEIEFCIFAFSYFIANPFSINMIKLLFECVSIRSFFTAVVLKSIRGLKKIKIEVINLAQRQKLYL